MIRISLFKFLEIMSMKSKENKKEELLVIKSLLRHLKKVLKELDH